MNLIAVARETIRITKEKQYELDGRTISLPDLDYTEAIVYTPEDGAALPAPIREGAPMCSFSVTTEDSFEGAKGLSKPLVMNFANAHSPGGGFLMGAKAQEEALCRCSTLYTSLRSEAAGKMYLYNNTHPSAIESDHMILSPNVCVFRAADCELLEEPFCARVITLPAPNRRGAAVFASKETVRQTFLRRIRIMLSVAAANGCTDLVLGAWGCGAFGNDPQAVAEAFRRVLVDERYGTAFDTVKFAVYGRPDGKNYLTFGQVFAADR